jgi:hypothetical protein
MLNEVKHLTNHKKWALKPRQMLAPLASMKLSGILLIQVRNRIGASTAQPRSALFIADTLRVERGSTIRERPIFLCNPIITSGRAQPHFDYFSAII